MEAKALLSPEILECGTSLAEQEHNGEHMPFGDTTKRPAKEPNKSTEDLARDIEALRAEIADDMLAPGCLSFASPFEAPPNQPSTDNKYLQLPLVYCDQTASNRIVQSIENYMQDTCLPLYGNTHTNTSVTGAQSTAFVAEARQIVAEETNARITGKASLDVVLFT